MAFGPMHWLASFVIFFAVLSVVAWSVVHLGKKEQTGNFTDVAVRLLDANEYLIPEGNKSPSTIERDSSTTRIIESTNSPTLFVDHQGFEISDITEFYEILHALSSTQNRVAGTTWDDVATTISAASVTNNSTWNRDVTYQSSDKSLASDNRRNVSETEIENKSAIRPPTMYNASFSDVNESRKSDLHSPIETKLVDFLRDGRNGTTEVFVPAETSAAARQTTQATHNV